MRCVRFQGNQRADANRKNERIDENPASTTDWQCIVYPGDQSNAGGVSSCIVDYPSARVLDLFKVPISDSAR